MSWFYAIIGVSIGIFNHKSMGGWTNSSGWVAIAFLIFAATFGLKWFFIAIGEIIIGYIMMSIIVYISEYPERKGW